MATEYGLRLREARKEAGLTQEALSKKTGIPQSTISTAEREGSGSGDTPLYADACGVSALWLANGVGEKYAKHYELKAEAGHYELPKQIDPPAPVAGEASATGMEIALLYDLIPVTDRAVSYTHLTLPTKLEV